jgi:hypothetical protein
MRDIQSIRFQLQSSMPHYAVGPANIYRSIIAVRHQILQRIGKILFSNDLDKFPHLFKAPPILLSIAKLW